MEFKLVRYLDDSIQYSTCDINDLIDIVNKVCHFAIRGDGEQSSYLGAYNACKSLLNGSETKVFLYSQKSILDVRTLLYITTK